MDIETIGLSPAETRMLALLLRCPDREAAVRDLFRVMAPGLIASSEREMQQYVGSRVTRINRKLDRVAKKPCVKKGARPRTYRLWLSADAYARSVRDDLPQR